VERTGIFYYKYVTARAIADICLVIQDHAKAFRLFKRLKKDCEYAKRYREKIYCYEQLGRTNREMRNYKDAVHSFKKMMNLAWAEKDIAQETRAYENLAIDYFYLGELDKAEYYHERFMRGKTENSLSIAKNVAINQIK
jgi:tetratricopeptide (TPR) repeat protein